jgi:hypothetical protein
MSGPRRSRRKTVLVADVPEGVHTIATVLGNKAKIVPCGELEDAVAQMQGGIDLVVCGVHFAESRMYDLLRIAKADAATREIPFVCFRDIDSALPLSLLEGLEIACSALGAVRFVDLHQLKAQPGVEQADHGFRKILLGYLE